MKVQTTAWIRFKVEIEDGSVVRVDMVDKTFNSQMTDRPYSIHWLAMETIQPCVQSPLGNWQTDRFRLVYSYFSTFCPIL